MKQRPTIGERVWLAYRDQLLDHPPSEKLYSRGPGDERRRVALATMIATQDLTRVKEAMKAANASLVDTELVRDVLAVLRGDSHDTDRVYQALLDAVAHKGASRP